jgi:hypothetical protein
MANFTITWVAPGATTSTDQVVEYRDISAGGSWTGSVTVGPTVGSYTFIGLDDNTAYEFRVTNNCVFGTPAVSTNILSDALPTCPEVDVTPNYTTLLGTYITVSYTPPATYAYQIYDFTLMNATGTSVIATNLGVIPSGIGVQTFNFTGLTASTTYQVRLQVKIDLSGTGMGPYATKDCISNTATTPANTTCNTPNLISVQPL